MQAYQENISAKVSGVLSPVLGVQVTVTDTITGNPAALFSDNGVTPITQALVTDETGYFGFYAANGSYMLSFSSAQVKIAPRNIQLYDPADDSPLTQAQAAASSGASKIGIGTETVENALNALQLTDYTALRAYTGPRKSVYVTGYLGTGAPSGIAGMFVRDDSDTTSSDNGGTVIVGTNGKRWTRIVDGTVNAKWFGTSGAIQSAITAAGTKYAVVIPSDYAGTDTYTNGSNIPVMDLRHQHLGVWSVIEPSRGVSQYPMGNDLVMRASGPADAIIEHLNVSATTTATLSVGSNVNVPISAVSVLNGLRGTVATGDTGLISTAATLVIARGTTNEEAVSTYSIVDGTHLNITCAKTHSGTTTIEQTGGTFLVSSNLVIRADAVKASGLSYNPPLVVNDSGLSEILRIPSDMSAPAPHGMLQIGPKITGMNGSNKDLLYQASTSSSFLRLYDNNGNQVAAIAPGGAVILLGGGLEVMGAATTNGSNGSVQMGRSTGTYTSTTDCFVVWGQNSDTLNPSNAAGSLVLASRNVTNGEVVLAAENTVNLRVGKTKLGFYGSAPVAKPAITGSRGGNAALASLLTALASAGLITDSTTA